METTAGAVVAEGVDLSTVKDQRGSKGLNYQFLPTLTYKQDKEGKITKTLTNSSKK